MPDLENFAGLLRCPACGADLDAADCAACGFEVPVKDGRPAFPFAKTGEPYETRIVALPEIEAALKAHFSLAGRGQAEGGVHHLESAHDDILRLCPADTVLLEIGCGGAQMRGYVEGLGLRYVGTDVSLEGVEEHLRTHGGADFLSDVHALPIRDSAVDVVYSAAVTQYFSTPHRAMQEIFRVLKPGGHYLGNCAFLEPWTDGSFFHATPSGAAALLLSAGFEIEAMWPSKGYTGYQSLLASGSRSARAVRWLGTPLRLWAELPYAAKRRLKGAAYDAHARAVDLARTAGGIDWIARKPG